MGEDGAALSGQAGRSRAQRQGQSPVCRSRAVDCSHRQSLARSAALVWTLEQRLHPLPRLGEGGGLAAVVRVLSGLAPPPLADEGSVGYRAASHEGADEDAVLGMRVG